MELREVSDPRDNWARARRMELVRYAHELGHTDIVEQMPKDLIVKRLKAAGVPAPSVPPRTIGGGPRDGDTSLLSHHYNRPAQKPQAETVTIDALDALERDWQQQQAAAANYDKMSINELRAACKASGIKLARTDGMESMRAKLNGQNPPG